MTKGLGNLMKLYHNLTIFEQILDLWILHNPRYTSSYNQQNGQVMGSNPIISYVFSTFKPENILKCNFFKHQNQLRTMIILAIQVAPTLVILGLLPDKHPLHMKPFRGTKDRTKITHLTLVMYGYGLRSSSL